MEPTKLKACACQLNALQPCTGAQTLLWEAGEQMLVDGAVVVMLIVANFQTTPAIPAPVPTNTPPGDVRLGRYYLLSTHIEFA